MQAEEYIENLESALVDLLDGNSKWWDIQANTGVSEERAREIEEFYNEIVSVNYRKKHGV